MAVLISILVIELGNSAKPEIAMLNSQFDVTQAEHHDTIHQLPRRFRWKPRSEPRSAHECAV
jgi:hypothetical protein